MEASAGKPESARRILSEGPWSSSAWTLYLQGLFASSAEEGERLLRRSVDRDPGLFPAWLTLAELLAARGNREGAREAADKARRLRPRDPRLARWPPPPEPGL